MTDVINLFNRGFSKLKTVSLRSPANSKPQMEKNVADKLSAAADRELNRNETNILKAVLADTIDDQYTVKVLEIAEKLYIAEVSIFMTKEERKLAAEKSIQVAQEFYASAQQFIEFSTMDTLLKTVLK